MSSIHIDPNRSEEAAAAREAVTRLNAEAREQFASNDTWRHDAAQQMTEEIYWGFEHENLISLLSNVENAPFDGRVFVKETRGLRAFWLARGGHIEASQLHSEVIELPRDTVGFHVFEFEDKLVTNFAESQSTLIDLGIQRLDAAVNQKVLGLFQTAVPSTSPYYVTGSGLSLTALNSALRAVRDTSMQQEITLVGRSTMTEQIMDAIMGSGSNGSGFLPTTNEELLNRGVIGNYRGASIVTLKNYRDDVDVPFFPQNELYVVGRDASKMAFWGGLLSKQYVEQDNWYWHYLARRDFGGIVHRPDRLRRIVDTSQPAVTYPAAGVEGF